MAFGLPPPGNGWLEHLVLAPECFRQEVAEKTSPAMSLDATIPMALPNFKRLGSVRKLMAVK